MNDVRRETGRKPRVVVVTRKSLYTQLLEHHGTVGQAEFYLQSRGEQLSPYVDAHERIQAAIDAVSAGIDADQRRASVDRDDLDRFLFADDDVIVIVGQDGLVPNVAKYLRGQPVIGVNPDPQRYDGVLCQHDAHKVKAVLAWTSKPGSEYRIQKRVMAEAVREDGQRLLALNEVFAGHRSHQSARYRIIVGGKSERQSSSGVICATGTGSTGWAKSIARALGMTQKLPQPEAPSLAWFAREPFPSVATGTELTFGMLREQEPLELISEMSDAGVLFADGIETDRVEFLAGQRVQIRCADCTLNLVVPATPVPYESTRAQQKPRPQRAFEATSGQRWISPEVRQLPPTHAADDERQ